MAIQRIQDTDPQLVSTLRIEPIETEILRTPGSVCPRFGAAYGIAEHAGGSPLLAIHLAETLVSRPNTRLAPVRAPHHRVHGTTRSTMDG